jgi:hypothetical protein
MYYYYFVDSGFFLAPEQPTDVFSVEEIGSQRPSVEERGGGVSSVNEVAVEQFRAKLQDKHLDLESSPAGVALVIEESAGTKLWYSNI